MSARQHDPVKDFLVQTYRDVVGDPRRTPPTAGRTTTGTDAAGTGGIGRFTPLSLPVVVAAALATSAPHLAATLARFEFAASALTTLHTYRWLLLAAAAATLTLDAYRFAAHRHRVTLDAHLRQITRHQPLRITVGFPTHWRTVRRATIRLPRGAVVRPKELDEFTTAVRATVGRSPAGYTTTVRHQAHRDRLLIARSPVPPETRSPRHLALQSALDATTIFKNPTVTVASTDNHGVETGYKITFTPSMNSGATNFQTKVDEALAALAGEHESGRNWTTVWTPSEGYLVMTLVAPLPTRVDHPLALIDENLRHLPYATAAADTTMVWDVSTRSNKPHCLIVGPTGGGKTSVIRTLLTEAARRGIPFVGVDPKMIELDGLEGYPGCGAIVYDAVRAAMLVRALHAEMTARNHYVHVNKIEPSELPLLIAVLDEFFILSGKWQRLAKTGDDETRDQLKELDPLGAWADLAVLARSAGIRLLLGVQRPDASLFGASSGNARDNFGTRISLGNLSQDGALMMWGDAHVGRDVDTSIPGRGMVTAPDGTPVSAQMWWTPNVDRHPNKWTQLTAADRALIDGLTPREAPQFALYSTELREFLESERALARRARSHGGAPEPIALGGTPATEPSTHTTLSTVSDGASSSDGEDAEDEVADAIPASQVTEGMTVLIDDGTSHLVAVTIHAVEVTYDPHTGDVRETTLTIREGRRNTAITFAPTEVVFLPEPDAPTTDSPQP
ncbi:putative FtsK/SpoIIIE family protein [Rhodococcus ruber BKS 20-38]|uniref:Putative FtsK/SpoIIIE family protein n=1 Tax=Rhodococcus ruber BKS 20-38 TaxID=1278076 RepID=M2X4P0_9NOCA|nr:FtsK/SpoIIIE domain-containing protein [Rhodococcus ruber]EME56006.1 putative FtsK/SpoIIIE family protein [Rhodococcus ruber BKS 20-38]